MAEPIETATSQEGRRQYYAGAGLFFLAVFIGGACASTSTVQERRPRPAGRLSGEPSAAAHWVYKGGFLNGWADDGWAPRDLIDGQAAKLDFRRGGGWAIRHSRPELSAADTLVFRFRADRSEPDFLVVELAQRGDGTSKRIVVTPAYRRALVYGWEEVRIPLHDFALPAQGIERIAISTSRPLRSGHVEVDHVSFTLGAVVSGDRSTEVVLDCRTKSRRVHDEIYGVLVEPGHNESSVSELKNVGVTARLLGGPAASRHHWRSGHYNRGLHGFFANETAAQGWTYRDFLDDNQAGGWSSALTVPTLGWVAKDSTSYAFSVKELGPQLGTDPNAPDRGSGVDVRGRLLSADPARTSLRHTTTDVRAWLTDISAQRPRRQWAKTRTFFLDYEPTRWHRVHRDVHPELLNYDALAEATIPTAIAIRNAMPDAMIAGPGLFGYRAALESAVDREAGALVAPDRTTHDDKPLLMWWLERVAAAEQKIGKRLVDWVDVHFRPTAEGVVTGLRDEDTPARRVRSVRSLWDEAYVDEGVGRGRVAQLVRLRRLVDSILPDRDIVVGAYTFGGDDDISGALAHVLALGHFARLGVRAAYLNEKLSTDGYIAAAFRVFRNYDDKGGAFGSELLPVRSPDGVRVFASRDIGRAKLVSVFVNMEQNKPAAVNLALAGCPTTTAARAFSLRAPSSRLRKHDVHAGKDGFDFTMAPWSVVVVELDVGRPDL